MYFIQWMGSSNPGQTGVSVPNLVEMVTKLEPVAALALSSMAKTALETGRKLSTVTLTPVQVYPLTCVTT